MTVSSQILDPLHEWRDCFNPESAEVTPDAVKGEASGCCGLWAIEFGFDVQLGASLDLYPRVRNAPRLREIVFQLCEREGEEGKLPDPIRKVLRLIHLQQ